MASATLISVLVTVGIVLSLLPTTFRLLRRNNYSSIWNRLGSVYLPLRNTAWPRYLLELSSSF